MTTKTLLDRERRAAERALAHEDVRMQIATGTYRPNAYERTIDFWTFTMTHDCPNKGAEIRNHRRHQLDERLHNIQHEVMTGELGYLYFIQAEVS